MVCWGIEARQSDIGLDALGMIKDLFPKSRKMNMEQVLRNMKENGDGYVPDPATGESHSGPMMAAEIVCRFLEGSAGELHYGWEPENRWFSALESFTISKKSLQWLSEYLKKTLQCSRMNAQKGGRKWNGWFKEKDWKAWQGHMEDLIRKMDFLIDLPEDPIELMHNSFQFKMQNQLSL